MTRYAAPPVSTASSVPELRPLALGELIDRSATFWRAHLKPLFLVCFGFELVNYTLSKSVLLLIERMTPLLQAGPALQAQVDADPMGALGQFALMFLSLGGLSLVLIWSYWLATMAVTRYVLGIQLGQPVEPMAGIRRALGRVGALTGSYVLSILWALLVGLLMMLPGGLLVGAGALLSESQAGAGVVVGLVLLVGGLLLMSLGALAAFLWYFLRFALLAPVLIMEEGGAGRAFRRSGQLVSGRVEPGFMGRVKVRAMVLLTVVSGILIAVSFASGLPAWVVRFAYGNPFDAAAVAANPIPQTLLVPVELLQVVGQSFFTPLALVFSAMFYLDMRMRREGLDLERRLEARIEARRP
jgi:hypothetical protein